MANSDIPLAAIRRILVGLGSAGTPAAVLDLATDLASAFHAEIAAVFVEEDILYTLSDYPATQAVSRGGKSTNVDRIRLSDAIAAQARASRRALSARAESNHVVWSFESRRGEALTVLRGSARADDVLLLTGTAGTITPQARMDFAIQAMGTARAVLVVPERLRHGRGAVVVFADDDAAHIELAANIAQAMHEQLLILLPPESARGAETLAVRRAAAGRFLRPRILRLPADAPDQIGRLLRSLQPRLVVSGSAGRFFGDAGIAALFMQAAGAPILLLRADA